MDINKIYNEDCLVTMNNMIDNNIFVDVVLTSPPYNTARHSDNHKEDRLNNYEMRYSDYEETKTLEEYNDWIVDIFNHYDRVLNKNGIVLFNISYGSENPNQMWLVIADIINKTNFMVGDSIIWKKSNALPNNMSCNKLTRICEFVFVFCRKDEYLTYNANKTISSTSKVGQNYYNSVYNFIEAKNNDGITKVNKATFSTDFCLQLLNMYAQRESDILVYDSFMGTGTTALASKMYGVNYLGSEISSEQCEIANKRLKGYSLSSLNKKEDKGKNKLF